MTFLLRTTALQVQSEWLDYSSMVSPGYGWKECPSQPVEVRNVWFAPSVLDVLGIWSGLGRHLFLLDVEGSPALDDGPQAGPAPLGRGPAQAVETSIEISRYGPNDPILLRYPNLSKVRRYNISYHSSSDTLTGRTTITCNGTGRNRQCAGPSARFAGLILNYKLSQDQFPIPDMVSTDPTTEPGAVLQFDQHLREWLAGLERPR
ncbi:MAG: hypothetical protein JO038_05055 [Alphaproteobacteria bacterium]|nr:hypothetical protein [Alphaproteobacteria bacterium]